MSNITRVYLITGFLGSGKTTLLNRIIDRYHKIQKLTLLVNEFGEIGVDGTLVEGEDIDMMEISKGSIFCACVKTDFIKGLYELNHKVKPDVLIIESTGVANPSDLKKDLNLSIFNDRFHFMEQFCLIDAAHFIDAYGVYSSIEKQIASSTVFIINKIDLASSDTIEKIKDVIRKFHLDPSFFETSYAEIPLGSFFDLPPSMLPDSAVDQPKKVAPSRLTGAELEQFIDNLLDSPELEITPPDTLMSAACRWEGVNLKQIRTMAEALPSSLVRAKGFVEEHGRMYLFNYVMGTWTVEESDVPRDRISHKNMVVFIGPPETIENLQHVTGTGNWSSIAAYQPSTPS